MPGRKSIFDIVYYVRMMLAGVLFTILHKLRVEHLSIILGTHSETQQVEGTSPKTKENQSANRNYKQTNERTHTRQYILTL